MSYVTLLQLAEVPGALELAQVASTSHEAVVAAELMDATLRGTDRSAWSAPEIAAADEAKARILEVITETAGLIDGFIGARYALPLAQVPVILVGWARAIVRYKVQAWRVGDEKTDPVVRDYRDAMKLLQLVADGKFSLGVEDPEQSPAALGDMRIETGDKVFGREGRP